MTLEKAKADFLGQKGYINKKTNEITVDHHLALKTQQVLPPGQDVVNRNIWNVYITSGQDLYKFSLFQWQDDQGKIFDQILSTFKFQ